LAVVLASVLSCLGFAVVSSEQAREANARDQSGTIEPDRHAVALDCKPGATPRPLPEAR
jgi:hypothetical protein